MSVIKTNPSDKISHIPMEGTSASLSFDNITFSHKAMAKKIAEFINNKKQIQLTGHKKENHSLELDTKQPMNNFPLQSIKVLKDNIDVFNEVKKHLSIETDTQVVEQSGILDIKGMAPLRVDNVFINNNVNNKLAVDSKDIIAHQETNANNDTVGQKDIILHKGIIDNKSTVNNTIAVGIHKDVTKNTWVDDNLTDDNAVMEYTPATKPVLLDEDDIPLFNHMIRVPLQNIPQHDKNTVTLQGNIRHQLSEGVKHTPDPLFAVLANEQLTKQTATQQNKQTKPSSSAISQMAPTPTQSETKLEVGREPLKQDVQINNPLNRLSQNSVKVEPSKNRNSQTGLLLGAHLGNEKWPAEQGVKDSAAPSIKPSLSFAQNEALAPPFTRRDISALTESKLTLLPEQFANQPSNEIPKPVISSQVAPTQDMDLPSHVMTPVINEMVMRPQLSSQVPQPNQGGYRTPEVMANNPFLNESNEPKVASRSFTYTFNHWPSSPSVTFELASKGEFLASTPSQEVQLALNENRHLLNHESSVQIRREDERQQHRNRQQHDQQQEED